VGGTVKASTATELRRLARIVERLHAAQPNRDVLLRVEFASALAKQELLGKTIAENGQLRAERETLKRWLLNQRRESDKWRTAYAELSLRARQP